MLALVLLFVAAVAHAGDLVVDMLDIGQGDAILIRTPAKKTILIDAGDRGAGLVEQLVAMGVDHLDLVIATHPHADHVGSMEPVIRAFPPKVYLDNGLPHTTSTYSGLMKAIEENPSITYKTAAKGSVFNLDDGARLEVLLPEAEHLFHDTRSDLNSNSVVTRLTHGDDCFLFLGDAEEPTERALVEQKVSPCSVLKVAHHGSNHSSIQALLDTVKPTTGLISVGAANRYHHPGDETLRRLEANKITIYRTDRDGRITAVSSGKGVTFTTERSERPGGMLAVSSVPNALPPPKVAPTAVGVAAAGPTQAPDTMDAEACPFPASKKSEVFHEAGCGNAQKIGPENLACYPTREAAVAAGKRPAGCCDP